MLLLPDPNAFGGSVRLKRGRGSWEDVPYASRGGADARGIGLHDMVEAIAAGAPHRASGRLGRPRRRRRPEHPVSAGEGRIVEISSSVAQPEALPVPSQA